jgi:hypothetical protein
MKKYLTLMAIAIIFLSCKKENAGTSVNDKPALSKTLYPIAFNLSAFETSKINKSKTVTNSISTTAIKDQIQFLHYFVFTGPLQPSAKLVSFKQIIQESSEASFGTILDSLPAGQYSIFFVGTQGPRGNVKLEQGAPIFYPNGIIDDTFNKQVNLTITDEVKQSVVLTRITAMITFKFTDIMPVNADRIYVSFENFPPGADLLTNRGRLHASGEDDLYPTELFGFSVNNTDWGKAGFTLSLFVWPYQYSTIYIDCIARNDKLIAHKEVLRIIPEFLANKNYILSGKLFDQKANFNVTINDKWNPPVNVPFNYHHKRNN